MRISVARQVLGVSADASLSEVKAAFKKKAFEKHPDRLPPNMKKHAEAEFQQVTDAYSCLKTATSSNQFIREREINNNVGKGGSRIHYACSAVPFLFIIFGTLCLGGAQATRAYKENKRHSLSQNPFLP